MPELQTIPKLAYVEFTAQLLLELLRRDTNIPKDAAIHRIQYDVQTDTFKLSFEADSLSEEFRTSEAQTTPMFEVIFNA